MLNWHFRPWAMGRAATMLRNVPDAAAAGAPAAPAGPPPAGDDAGVTGEPPADPAVPAAAGQVPADDEDDDADDTLDTSEFADLEHDPRVKKLLARNQKLSRRDRRHTPVVRALQAMGVDLKKNPQALADLLHNARAGSDLQRELARNPRLKALVHGGGEPPADTRPAPRDQDLPEDLPFEWDESRFSGWDRSDPTTGHLITELKGQAKANHDLRITQNKLVNVLRVLSREVADLREGGVRAQRQQAGQQWRSAVDGAAAKLGDPEVAEEFRYAVYGRLQRASRDGQRLNPQEVVEAVLKRFQRTGQITGAQAARATAAQQQIADRNRTLPRPAALVGGAPASPTVDRSQERIRDVSKRLVGRGYVGLR